MKTCLKRHDAPALAVPASDRVARVRLGAPPNPRRLGCNAGPGAVAQVSGDNAQVQTRSSRRLILEEISRLHAGRRRGHGRLLRREGLYSSLGSHWMAQWPP